MRGASPAKVRRCTRRRRPYSDRAWRATSSARRAAPPSTPPICSRSKGSTQRWKEAATLAAAIASHVAAAGVAEIAASWRGEHVLIAKALPMTMRCPLQRRGVLHSSLFLVRRQPRRKLSTDDGRCPSAIGGQATPLPAALLVTTPIFYVNAGKPGATRSIRPPRCKAYPPTG